jgi:hypothetical protein
MMLQVWHGQGLKVVGADHVDAHFAVKGPMAFLAGGDAAFDATFRAAGACVLFGLLHKIKKDARRGVTQNHVTHTLGQSLHVRRPRQR